MGKFLSAFCFLVLTLLTRAAWGAPGATGTVSRLAREAKSVEGNGKYFFHDLYDVVDYFMKNPSSISVYSTKSGRFVEGGAKANVASAKLCDPLKSVSSKIIKNYNEAKADSPVRRNFWIVASACLAAHEGAEAWLNNSEKGMNKLDTPGIPHRKYLYGVFQLSSERGASVDVACEKSWKNFSYLSSPSGLPESYLNAHAELVNLSDSSRSGTQSTSGGLKSLGKMDRQRFNIYAGVHELLRAASASKTCLDPFDRTQNRYGPLRTASRAYISCVNEHGPKVMSAGVTIDGLVEAILRDPNSPIPDEENLSHH